MAAKVTGGTGATANIKSLGLDFRSAKANPAHAARNLRAAVRVLGDEKVAVKDRIRLSSDILNFAHACPPELKLDAFKAAAPAAETSLICIMKVEDDEVADGGEVGDYNENGLQNIAKNLSEAMRYVVLNSMDTSWALFWCPVAFRVLNAPGVSERLSSASNRCQETRRKTVLHLLRSAPSLATAYTSGWTLGDIDDPVSILSKYQTQQMTPDIRREADTLLEQLYRFDKARVAKHGNIAAGLMKRLRIGDSSVVKKLDPSMYDQEPDVFKDNVVFLLSKYFAATGHIYHSIATKHHDVVVPAFDTLAALVEGKESTIPHGQESIVCLLIKHVALASPELVAPRLEHLVQKMSTFQHCEALLPSIIGATGRAQGAADKCVHMLMKMMSTSGDAHVPIYLNELCNLLPFASSRAVMDPHMKAIEDVKRVSSLLASHIEDWHENRSLANAYERIGQLEQLVKQMSAQLTALKK